MLCGYLQAHVIFSLCFQFTALSSALDISIARNAILPVTLMMNASTHGRRFASTQMQALLFFASSVFLPFLSHK